MSSSKSLTHTCLAVLIDTLFHINIGSFRSMIVSFKCAITRGNQVTRSSSSSSSSREKLLSASSPHHLAFKTKTWHIYTHTLHIDTKLFNHILYTRSIFFFFLSFIHITHLKEPEKREKLWATCHSLLLPLLQHGTMLAHCPSRQLN